MIPEKQNQTHLEEYRYRFCEPLGHNSGISDINYRC